MRIIYFFNIFAYAIKCKILTSTMSLSQLPVLAEKVHKLTFEHLVRSINLLKAQGDFEKFNKIASDLQAVICDGLKSKSDTLDLLSVIREGLNKVRIGSHKNRAVGQGSMTCCSYISLMFVHLIRCKNVKDDMNKCDYRDCCGRLGAHLQRLINNGKLCHITIMNILTHGHPKKDPNFPELGDLTTLLNEVMPNQLINSPRAIDPLSGIIRSDVEDVSTDLDQGHLVWTNMGQIIRMLEELQNNGEDSTLGEVFCTMSYIYYMISLFMLIFH